MSNICGQLSTFSAFRRQAGTNASFHLCRPPLAFRRSAWSFSEWLWSTASCTVSFLSEMFPPNLRHSDACRANRRRRTGPVRYRCARRTIPPRAETARKNERARLRPFPFCIGSRSTGPARPAHRRDRRAEAGSVSDRPRSARDTAPAPARPCRSCPLAPHIGHGRPSTT
jgi:hypothetical protein